LIFRSRVAREKEKKGGKSAKEKKREANLFSRRSPGEQGEKGKERGKVSPEENGWVNSPLRGVRHEKERKRRGREKKKKNRRKEEEDADHPHLLHSSLLVGRSKKGGKRKGRVSKRGDRSNYYSLVREKKKRRK